MTQGSWSRRQYAEFTASYMGIKARSRSMSAGDRDRPVRIIDFLESEMRDAWQFSGLTYEAYSSDSALRRNVERGIENQTGASIDTEHPGTCVPRCPAQAGRRFCPRGTRAL